MDRKRFVPLVFLVLAATATAQQLQVSDARHVAIGDVTGDGRADVVLATGYFGSQSATNYKLFVFRQTATGTLAPPWSVPLPQGGAGGIALGDLNHDGVDDIVVGVQGIMIVTHAKGRLYARTFPNWSTQAVALTDVDGDGTLDVVGAGAGGGWWSSIYYGDGHGWIDSTLNIREIANTAWLLRMADFNHDGHDDVVAYSYQGVSVYLHDGVDSFLPTAIPIQPGYAVAGMTVADFNDDGLADIVTSGGGTVSVFKQQSQGGLAAPIHLASYDNPETLLSADLDGNGRDDIVVAHPTHTLDYYLNGSTTASLETQAMAVSVGPSGMAVGDIDSDGCPDYALAVPGMGLYVHRHECAQPSDMAVRAVATQNNAVARVQHVVGDQPIELVHASIRLRVRSGSLQLGALPEGCVVVAQSATSASLSCLIDSLPPGTTTDVVIPLGVSGEALANELQMHAEVSSDSRERTLTNNVAYSRIRIDGTQTLLAPRGKRDTR